VALQQAATANGWAYVDLAPIVQALTNTRDANGRTNEIRKCQDLPAATTAAQLQSAVLNTCPVTGPTAAPNFFGNSVSLDGVHPSAAGAKSIANAVIARINAVYSKSVPTVP
jgi:lysophospholipase L1-like esterase